MMNKDYSHAKCKVLIAATLTPAGYMSIPESGDSSISHLATFCTEAVVGFGILHGRHKCFAVGAGTKGEVCEFKRRKVLMLGGTTPWSRV